MAQDPIQLEHTKRRVLLSESRMVSRLRDERSAYADIGAIGITRRALPAAGACGLTGRQLTDVGATERCWY